MRASRAGGRCELRGARISTTRGTRPGEAGHDVESIRPSYVPGVKESSVCLPEKQAGILARLVIARFAGSCSGYSVFSNASVFNTQEHREGATKWDLRAAERRAFELSLANQTRTSQRSCIVVRERQSSPGDRIGTSMRTSDGPSRHQVSGKILHPRSDRDRRACPGLQGFVLQYVRDCDAGTGRDEPRLVKSLAFSTISLFSPQGDPRDGPPPFCSR